MRKIQNEDTVKVHYTGRLEDGTVFDSSMVEGRDPLTATLGQGQLISGFESGLIDMSVGDTKEVQIDPSDAYGEYLPNMEQEVPLENMPGEVSAGMQLQAQTEMGPIILTVKEVKESTVVLDANHPLAGKKLIFDLEVLEIQ
jgi:FKBP-type peptidyl-prolyl cis-trans isomerase SlpA